MKDFGIYVCEKSIRDEGSSYHYAAPEKYAYLDTELTKKLDSIMQKYALEYKTGVSWIIDAIYRETKAEIAKYKKEGVVTVEMESSALFTIAKYRGVKIASAFVVTDLLGNNEWTSKFEMRKVKEQLYQLFDISINCLFA